MSVTFIEASAGTGKTYTLVSRVVELVRRGVPAEAILMVTFTEKATDELKDRIRAGLTEAYREHQDETLAQALEDWSSLTITTIHGFCRMLLTQFPLESGVSFEPELVDQAERSRRLLREELRPRLDGLGTLPFWAGLEDEDDLLALAARAVNDGVFEKPLLHPDTGESALFDRLKTGIEDGTGELWTAVRALPRGLPEEPSALAGADRLNATTSKVPYRVARDFAAASTWRELAEVLDRYKKDAADYLDKWDEAAWKKAGPPASGLLAAVREAAPALADALRTGSGGVSLAPFLRRVARHRLLESLVRRVLERRSTRELTYRDLIDRARQLTGQGALDKAARRWKAVLIDEFQDTDQDQWEIFSRLFLRDDCQLTVVGDPKQSIYRFRGADLDVYRAAREQVAGRASFEVLQHNYRSTAAMIEAVNALFDADHTPWPRREDFAPSLKGDKAIETLRDTAGELPAVARFSAASEEDWHRHLAVRLLSLLKGHVLDDGQKPARPVTPSDILVLVRRHHEADAVAQLLASKGVPVAVGAGGLLATREASEVALFLKALESPGSLTTSRALGWTRLLAGADAETLAPAVQIAQDDRYRGAFLRAFRRVAAALDGAADGGGLETLLEHEGGTRVVTNVEHVLEVLQDRFHRGEVSHGQAALSLERWMESRRQEDEIELRRDGDSPVVRVMTIHSAKGLEAPIVLHGWPDKPRARDLDWIVTSQGVDFLLTDKGKAIEAANEAAETLRLRYVAMTRARTHQAFYDEAAEVLPTWTAEAWALVPRWQPPSAEAGPQLAPPLRGLEGRHPWIESHSGLWRRAQGEHVGGTEWDRPRVTRDLENTSEIPSETVEVEALADQLPAGPAFGDLVHDVLESADWRGWSPDAAAAKRAETFDVVETHVQRHRSRLPVSGLARLLDRWLARVLSQPLALGDAPPVRFTDLAPEVTRRELEFHLPFAHQVPQAFHWGGREFFVHPGYLTGRIDVLFAWHGRLYLADWKTNRLSGQTPEDVMAEAGYDLQAQWYWEALTRLCSVQSEPLEPGGVLYVFLRGAGDQPAGVFLSPETLSAQSALSPFLVARHG